VTLNTRRIMRTLRARVTGSFTRGQGLSEYTLIVGLVALVSVSVLTGFGVKVAAEIGQFVSSF
jgi:hypothetical protein